MLSMPFLQGPARGVPPPGSLVSRTRGGGRRFEGSVRSWPRRGGAARFPGGFTCSAMLRAAGSGSSCCGKSHFSTMACTRIRQSASSHVVCREPRTVTDAAAISTAACAALPACAGLPACAAPPARPPMPCRAVPGRPRTRWQRARRGPRTTTPLVSTSCARILHGQEHVAWTGRPCFPQVCESAVRLRDGGDPGTRSGWS